MDSDQINHESLMAMAEQTNELQSQLAAQAAHIALLREALDKLARLGNEPLLGNSIGNQIAQQALAIPNNDAALREWGARLLEEMAEADAGPLYLRRRAAELRSGK